MLRHSAHHAYRHLLFKNIWNYDWRYDELIPKGREALYDQKAIYKEQGNSRLGVMVVWVHIDVPQTQLMQLANDLLHGIHVLVGHSIQRTSTGGRSRHLGVGEVQQPVVACAGDDLIHVFCSQVGVPASARLVLSVPTSNANAYWTGNLSANTSIASWSSNAARSRSPSPIANHSMHCELMTVCTVNTWKPISATIAAEQLMETRSAPEVLQVGSQGWCTATKGVGWGGHCSRGLRLQANKSSPDHNPDHNPMRHEVKVEACPSSCSKQQ